MHLKYVAVNLWMDDLYLCLREPQKFVNMMVTKFNFHFKGTGPMSYHLGTDVSRDDDCITPTKYIEKLVTTYKQIFGEKP